MKIQDKNPLSKKYKFEVSLRYELFYSLNILLDPNSRIHSGWKKAALKTLGDEFLDLMTWVGHSWEIWPVMASLMPCHFSNPRFDQILEFLEELPLEIFREKVLRGLIHSEEALEPLLKGKTSLKGALSRVPKTKRDWTSHIGLFPYDPKSPQIVALENLISDTESFRTAILQIIETYWKKSFQDTWELLQPQLRRSLEAHERLFHSCSFNEFARQALLRIEVDETKEVIVAIRGGYRLKFQDVEACYFLPSAFNDRRFWSSIKDDGKRSVVYFPYFDPAVTLDFQIADKILNVADPALDPALIFKALGDSTRFAIATVLARAPTSSVELAKILSVSKPTISHHVHLLREAGLLQQTYINGAVELQLKRSVLEKLSDLTVAKLFDDDRPLQIIRTRGGVPS